MKDEMHKCFSSFFLCVESKSFNGPKIKCI